MFKKGPSKDFKYISDRIKLSDVYFKIAHS